MKISMKNKQRILFAAALSFCGLASAAVTNVVSNGSFEGGTTGWSTGPAGTTVTACGFNSAAPAPGTETITSTPGFAATQGTDNVIGALQQSTNASNSCVIYQDVAIPAGATTANFSADIGVKNLGGKNPAQSGVFYGLYPTTSVPNYPNARSVSFGSSLYQSGSSDAALTTVSVNNVNVSSVAGTTVRLAFLIASNSSTGSVVAGLDNVSLNVTYTPVVAAPALADWAKMAMAALLLGVGAIAVARRRS